MQKDNIKSQRPGPGRMYSTNQNKPYRTNIVSSKTLSSKLLIAIIAVCLTVTICVIFLVDSDTDDNTGNIINESVDSLIINDFIEQPQSLPPPMTSEQVQEGDTKTEIEEIEYTAREG